MLYKKCALAFAISLMSLSMPILAEETEIPIDKTLVQKDGTLPADGLDFTFSIQPATDQVEAAAGHPSDTVFNGVENGLVIEGSANTANAEKTAYSGARIQTDASRFSIPGIYRYYVSENAVQDTPLYEGISTDPTVYTIDLYVGNDSAGHRTIMNALVYRGEGSAGAKVDTLTFSNTYDPNTSFTLTKQLAGNQANMQDVFEFGLRIQGQEGETYRLFVNGKEAGTISAGKEGIAQTSVDLGHNDQLTIVGLSPSDTYILQETNMNGYTSSWPIDGDTQLPTYSGKGDAQLTVTNEKSGTIPTGLFINSGPAILVLIVAIGFGLLFFKKKRVDE